MLIPLSVKKDKKQETTFIVTTLTTTTTPTTTTTHIHTPLYFGDNYISHFFIFEQKKLTTYINVHIRA